MRKSERLSSSVEELAELEENAEIGWLFPINEFSAEEEKTIIQDRLMGEIDWFEDQEEELAHERSVEISEKIDEVMEGLEQETRLKMSRHGAFHDIFPWFP